MPAVTKSISIPDDLFEDAETRRRALRYQSFSDYVKDLIRQDLVAWERQNSQSVAPRQATPDDPQGRYILNEQPPDRDSSVRKALKEVANALEDLDSLGAGKPKPPEN